MRVLSISMGSAFLTVCLGIGAFGQDSSEPIRGPVLGFVPNDAGTSIQPILGIPGASIFGPPLVLGSEVRNTVVSPKQDYALAVRGPEAEPVVIRFDGNPLESLSSKGIRPGADVIAISPGGTAAALYGHGNKVLQSIGRPSEAAGVVFESSVSDIPGRLRGLAVADDGTLALLNFADGDTTALWVVSLTGSRWLVPAARPSAANFLKGRHDIVVADDATQEVFLVLAVDGTPSRVPLAAFGDGFDSIAGVAESDDGRRILISSRSTGTVTLFDMATGLSAVLPCNCQTSGLHRLKGDSVFRLSGLSDTPVSLLEASSAEPRVLVIPPPEAVWTVLDEPPRTMFQEALPK
jgi:hypothetical protein